MLLGRGCWNVVEGDDEQDVDRKEAGDMARKVKTDSEAFMVSNNGILTS